MTEKEAIDILNQLRLAYQTDESLSAIDFAISEVEKIGDRRLIDLDEALEKFRLTYGDSSDFVSAKIILEKCKVANS